MAGVGLGMVRLAKGQERTNPCEGIETVIAVFGVFRVNKV